VFGGKMGVKTKIAKKYDRIGTDLFNLKMAGPIS